jgi:hypothetical protein
MGNSHFQRRSAVFECRHCGRLTRDVNGSNGCVRLCEDCEDGCQWENGGTDTDDTTKRDACFAKANECFQRAVNKGGTIEGYAAQ